MFCSLDETMQGNVDKKKTKKRDGGQFEQREEELHLQDRLRPAFFNVSLIFPEFSLTRAVKRSMETQKHIAACPPGHM